MEEEVVRNASVWHSLLTGTVLQTAAIMAGAAARAIAGSPRRCAPADMPPGRCRRPLLSATAAVRSGRRRVQAIRLLGALAGSRSHCSWNLI